jgi:Glycosyl transferase family 2
MGDVVYGVTMVKDERDVIRGFVEHTCGEVDHLLIADNLSTDGTSDILTDLARELPITIVADNEPGYYQSFKMTALANQAAAMGATIIVPLDADELWYAPDGRRLADTLTEMVWPVTFVPIINHLATWLDVDDPDPFRAMVWRQRLPQEMGKVAFRWEPGATIMQGNHGVNLPSLAPDLPLTGGSLAALRHFPVRSPEQMISKGRNGSAAYAAAPDLPAEFGEHWKAWGQILDTYGEGALHEAYREHWRHKSPVDIGLIRDPAPYRRWGR